MKYKKKLNAELKCSIAILIHQIILYNCIWEDGPNMEAKTGKSYHHDLPFFNFWRKVRTVTLPVHNQSNFKEFNSNIVLISAKDLRETSPNGKKMTLEDYDIPNNGTLTMVCRVRGGSNQQELPPPAKAYGDDVELTNEPDMFTLDDDEGGQRAKMPCGHAISKQIQAYSSIQKEIRRTSANIYIKTTCFLYLLLIL